MLVVAVLFGVVRCQRGRRCRAANVRADAAVSGPVAEFASLVKEQAIAEYHLR